MLDGQLFLPECWFDAAHAALRQETGIPTQQPFLTKPQLAVQLVERIVESGGLPFQWVVADALYGDSPAFRDAIAAMHLWYFTEIARSTLIWRRQPALVQPIQSGEGRKPKRL